MSNTNLSHLIKNMQPILSEASYVFCCLDYATYQSLSLKPLCMFAEDEGITIILEEADATSLGLNYVGKWSLITCKIQSSLEAVGFLAAMSTELAKASIAVNAISAYHHDHLLVPKEKANLALAVLTKLSSQF